MTSNNVIGRISKAVDPSECYIYTYIHTQPEDVPAVKEASQ